jgi:hypothetical protein
LVKIGYKTKIWTNQGECFEGIIDIGKGGMTLSHASGYSQYKEDLVYEIRNSIQNKGGDIFQETPLDTPIRVKLDSFYVTERPYAKESA